MELILPQTLFPVSGLLLHEEHTADAARKYKTPTPTPASDMNPLDGRFDFFVIAHMDALNAIRVSA